MVKWPAGRRQNRKQAEPEFFPLSAVGLVKVEILALLTCTCMRVGKSRPPSVTEIWSQIANGCSCFSQEVRALYNRCTSRTCLPTGVLKVPTEYLTMMMRKSAFSHGKIPDFSVYIAEPGGRWPLQNVNNEVGGTIYLVV